MTEAMPFLQKRYYFLTTPARGGAFLLRIQTNFGL